MSDDLTDALQLVMRFVDHWRMHEESCSAEDDGECTCHIADLDAALARIVRACEEAAALDLSAALKYVQQAIQKAEGGKP